LGTLLEYRPINNDFINNFLGIDSIHIAGERYYANYAVPPFYDTLFGFIDAESIDTLLPSLKADTIRDPFTPRLRNYWTLKTPPGVANFKLNEYSTPTHRFNAVYPLQSIQQNQTIGMRRDFPEFDTYAYVFGFHLWYMDTVDAENLIRSIFNEMPSAVGANTHIEPNILSGMQLNLIDPEYIVIYLGNLQRNRFAGQILTGSILINDSLGPLSTQILPAYEGYFGEVLRIEMSLRDFLRPYLPVWDTTTVSFAVDAVLDDGLSLKAIGNFSLIGQKRGDINNDHHVNILDLTLLIEHLFRGERLPQPSESADLDANGSVNILDLTKLIDYIFRGGR
jgi:hypothetical protein